MMRSNAETAERVKALTENLETGVKEVFESEKYRTYLKAMSRFHHYSFGNVMLILMQCPEASLVAGYTTWKKQFGRTVKKGEHGIQIIAPVKRSKLVSQDKLDPDTQQPVIGPDGKPEKEPVFVQVQGFQVVLFFAMGIFSSAASFRELQRPEFALRHFPRFLFAKVAVGRGMEIMTAIFAICGGVASTVMGSMGTVVTQTATLPAEIVTAIENVGFMESIPLWLVSFLGSLFITVMSFILILTVYGRFFRLYLYTALSPLPFASFAGENSSAMGKAFVKSYVGVCLEGAVIVLACLIYSAFLSSDAPSVDTTLPAVTMAWQYLGQLSFNMLVLTGLVKGADRLVREMFSL